MPSLVATESPDSRRPADSGCPICFVLACFMLCLTVRPPAGTPGGVPALAGVPPGGETVDFRPTFGPPSLLEAVILKTKKGIPDISPSSPTKQESIDGEEFGMEAGPPTSRNSAGRRTPDARYASFLLCLCYA